MSSKFQLENKSSYTSIEILDPTGSFVVPSDTLGYPVDDYLYEAIGNYTATFNGGAGYDQLTLDRTAVSRSISAARVRVNGSFVTQWTIKSQFSSAENSAFNSTIIANDLEWLEVDGEYYDLQLAAIYLRVNNLSTSIQFSLFKPDITPPSSGFWMATIRNSQTFGSANDIVYLRQGAERVSLGAGNDLISSFSNRSSIDGGTGNDIYVMPSDNPWEYKILPNSSDAQYSVIKDAADGNVYLFVETQPQNLLPANVYLRNVETIVYQDKSVGVVLGTDRGEKLDGQSSLSSVVAGGLGNDTMNGTFGGDTLLGGDGNDLIFAISGASGNVVRNGSFETNGVQRGRWAYRSAIDGWSSYRFDGRNWVVGGQMEVWNQFAPQRASHGSSLVEIDADRQYNGIGQTLRGLTNGTFYQVSFDMTARNNPSQETLDVYWGNAKIGEFKATSRGVWKTHSFVVQANAATETLRFLELAQETDGLGVLLDNVKVEQVNRTPNLLIGGTGRDTLVGSIGTDVFVFDIGDTGTTRTTADVIQQFTSGQDVVDITKITEGRTLQFGGNTFSPDDFQPEIITQNVGGGILALIDSDGNNSADAAIFFEGVTRLTARDFKSI